MAKPISVDFTNTTDSSFYVSPGTYPVTVKDANVKQGAEYPYIEWQFEVIGKGVKLKNNTTLKPDALWNLKQTLGALLGKEIPKSVVNLDLDKLMNRTCTAVIADREYNGKIYSNIVRLEAYVPPTTTGGNEALDDLASL